MFVYLSGPRVFGVHIGYGLPLRPSKNRIEAPVGRVERAAYWAIAIGLGLAALVAVPAVLFFLYALIRQLV